MFKGFQNTSLLWYDDDISGLDQFSIPKTNASFISEMFTKKLRLGKWAELFTIFQLNLNPETKIVCENLQIIKNKQTLGEIDVLLLQNNMPFHIEIAYKFYLYDPSNDYDLKLNHWIGPNRKDSLVQKLDKIKERQLPLLFKEETKEILDGLNINLEHISQCVHFKAQLFLPYNAQNINIEPLNKDCIKGWYLSGDALQELRNYQFYLPKKLEWLCEPNLHVEWLMFSEASELIKYHLNKRQSPLCWIKDSNEKMQKCFITWW